MYYIIIKCITNILLVAQLEEYMTVYTWHIFRTDTSKQSHKLKKMHIAVSRSFTD